jgi:hypothetical protein
MEQKNKSLSHIRQGKATQRTMLWVSVLVLMTAVAGACGTASRKDISFLRAYDGKYPQEVGLLDNDKIKGRLEKMLGARYLFVKDSMGVETPITIADSTFSATGCQKHNCSETNFIIVVDLSKNLMFVGIRQNGKIETYSEDGSKHPYIELWEQPQE